jgi:protein-tyrosine kinase
MSIVENVLQKVRQEALARAAASGNTATGGPRVAENLPAARKSGGEALPPAVPVIVPERPVFRVDLHALRAAGLLPPQAEERALAEQLRQVKRPLLANATGRGAPALASGRLIMVASALPGEGKTFTCINLAMSMAFERDIHVVLVDGDVAKPNISRVLGLGAHSGLMDALRDSNLDVESLVLPTDIPGLSVLPAGQPMEHVTELLASDRMRQITQRISEYDPRRVVVWDSPPLLLTTESVALAQAVGQVLLVVHAGRTVQESVLDAVERLGGKPTSVVLNQCVPLSGEPYRYYGSGPRDSTTAAA